MLDGHDVKSLNVAYYRSKIGYVGQVSGEWNIGREGGGEGGGKRGGGGRREQEQKVCGSLIQATRSSFLGRERERGRK